MEAEKQSQFIAVRKMINDQAPFRGRGSEVQGGLIVTFRGAVMRCYRLGARHAKHVPVGTVL